MALCRNLPFTEDGGEGACVLAVRPGDESLTFQFPKLNRVLVAKWMLRAGKQDKILGE